MNRHALLAREIDKRLQTIRTSALEDRDRLDLAFARTQRFEHCIWTID